MPSNEFLSRIRAPEIRRPSQSAATNAHALELTRLASELDALKALREQDRAEITECRREVADLRAKLRKTPRERLSERVKATLDRAAERWLEKRKQA